MVLFVYFLSQRLLKPYNCLSFPMSCAVSFLLQHHKVRLALPAWGRKWKHRNSNTGRRPGWEAWLYTLLLVHEMPSLMTCFELWGSRDSLFPGRDPRGASGVHMLLASTRALSVMASTGLNPLNPKGLLFVCRRSSLPICVSEGWIQWTESSWQLMGNSQWRTVDFGAYPAVSPAKPKLPDLWAHDKPVCISQLFIWGA